jgi:hypothetical protein
MFAFRTVIAPFEISVMWRRRGARLAASVLARRVTQPANPHPCSFVDVDDAVQAKVPKVRITLRQAARAADASAIADLVSFNDEMDSSCDLVGI